MLSVNCYQMRVQVLVTDKEGGKNMRKKLLRSVSVVLTLALVFSVVTGAPFAVSAAETDVSQAVAASDYASFGEPNDGKYTLESKTYQLTDDFAAKGFLFVPSGVTAVIDLNGHTISRDLTEYSLEGFIIRNDGTLTINDSSGNNSGKITGGYAYKGGAVNNNGTLTINGGSFVNNRANYEAGAVINDGVLTVKGGIFANNSTESYGGGAFVNYGTMTVSGGKIKGNIAKMDGGAIFNADGATLNLTAGKITGNKAGLKAGGVYNSSAATLNMKNYPVVKDNANGNLWLGGNSVINIIGTFTNDTNVDVRADNMASGRAITNGFRTYNRDYDSKVFTFAYGARWAVLDENGEVVPFDFDQKIIVNSWNELKEAVGNDNTVIELAQDITNPTRNASDPIKITDKRVFIDMKGHTIDRNRTTAHDDGHVFWLTGISNLTIYDTVGGGVIKGGYATNGGGINIGDYSTLELYNVTVSGNKAVDGGGIFVRGWLNINGAVIEDNSSTDDGGAIHISDDASEVSITNAVITGNHGNGSDNDSQAGAIYQHKNITTTIENTFIDDNDSNKKGGGIYLRTGKIDMTGGSVSGNTSTEGGGVYVTNNTTFTANGTLFRGNEATSGSGGAINDEGYLTLTDCTVTNNSASAWGGGIYLANDTDASLSLNSGRIEHNHCDNYGGGVHVSETADMSVSGAPVVKNNTGGSNSAVNNLRLAGKKTTIAVSGSLTYGAELNVNAFYYDRVLATGLTSEGDLAYFNIDEASDSNDFTEAGAHAKPSLSMSQSLQATLQAQTAARSSATL